MTEIVVEQRIKAPPSTVYRYLTESDRWKMWQGADAILEARVGGIFSILMANGMNARGQFVELVPDERVVFTWGWVDRPGIPPGSTTVEITLNPDGEGTLLVFDPPLRRRRRGTDATDGLESLFTQAGSGGVGS